MEYVLIHGSNMVLQVKYLEQCVLIGAANCLSALTDQY